MTYTSSTQRKSDVFLPALFLDVTDYDPVTQIMDKYMIDAETVSKILDIEMPIIEKFLTGNFMEGQYVTRFVWALEPSIMQGMVDLTPELSLKERRHITGRINLLERLKAAGV